MEGIAIIKCANASPEENEICHFDDTFDNCKQANLWGFKDSRPCIFLTLNITNLSFMPEPYSITDDLPDDMPQKFKETIKKGILRKLIFIHCSHASEYNPFPGFYKDRYFTVINNTNFLTPLIGVIFDLKNTNYLDVECTLWSKHPHPKVKFRIGKRC